MDCILQVLIMFNIFVLKKSSGKFEIGAKTLRNLKIQQKNLHFLYWL